VYGCASVRARRGESKWIQRIAKSSRVFSSELNQQFYEVMQYGTHYAFCGAEMRIIAFVTEPATVRKILQHLGEPTRSPRFAPARGPPLWEAVTAAPSADHDPRWDPSAQSLPEIEFDQRLVW